MGALPGGCVLSHPPGRVAAWFDVERFRQAGRTVVIRSVDRPTLVLGSTQDAGIVDHAHLRRGGVQLVRRRSGGGAVLIQPGAQVWVDIWVPRDDPLWSVEPRASAVRVGNWWAASLAPIVEPDGVALTVQSGPAPHLGVGDLVCFAGVGAGEVLVGNRKLVGLAQWRSRQGALVHGCAYRVWDASAITQLLLAYSTATHQGGSGPDAAGAALQGRAVGLNEVGAATWTAEHLLAALPDPLTWEILRS